MRTLTIILLIVVSNLTIAQTTAIPDANFEQELINLGLDATIDGQVLTNNIDTVTSLQLTFNGINDLSGIEDFTSLTHLKCWNPLTSFNITQNTALIWLNIQGQFTNLDVTQNAALEFLNCSGMPLTSIDVTQNIALDTLICISNQLTSLDVTQNTALTYLVLANNQLTSLDLTQNLALSNLNCELNQLPSLDVTLNTALTGINCSNNQLSSIDVTQNTALIGLGCGNNQLTSIDVTQNIALTTLLCEYNQLNSLNLSQNIALNYFWCYSNNLNCLNVRNGNNINIGTDGFMVFNNPSLFCIEVDDSIYADTNFFDVDSHHFFNTNCGPCAVVGLDEIPSTNVSIYPNPTSGRITISLEDKTSGSLRVLNSLGQVVLEEGFEAIRELNISLDEPSGLYFLQVEIDGELITKKVVKE